MKLVIPLIFVASSSWATCGGYDQTFLYCQIENNEKILSVCFDDESAIYRFGPAMDAPELELTTSIAKLNYTPWLGVGSAIWEEVVFFNEGYSYTAITGLLRIFPDDNETVIGEKHFGGVIVHRGSVQIADLTCDPATITHDWVGGLSHAKNNLGLIWNYDERDWVALPD